VAAQVNYRFSKAIMATFLIALLFIVQQTAGNAKRKIIGFSENVTI